MKINDPAEARVTEFQKRVYACVQSVPIGRVATYAGVARAVGCGSARAIGQALRKNPFAPAVPCHRIIASDLTPGGFQGSDNGARVASKLRILRREGVIFLNGRLTDPSRLMRLTARG